MRRFNPTEAGGKCIFVATPSFLEKKQSPVRDGSPGRISFAALFRELANWANRSLAKEPLGELRMDWLLRPG